MNDNDRRLVDIAEHLAPADVDRIDSLIEQAASEEARQRMQNVKIRFHHLEEYYCDML
ncbi:MAG: hypothetical protein K2M06_01990 [Muribaculaceae bacterium]|nr:hypothetical protein [Muribaculaceae bacterium]